MELSTSASDLAQTITIFDGFDWIKYAWNLVKGNTISSCFRRAGFLLTTDEVQSADDFDLDNSLILLMTEAGFPDILTAEYLPIDNDVAIKEEISDISSIAKRINNEKEPLSQLN